MQYDCYIHIVGIYHTIAYQGMHHLMNQKSLSTISAIDITESIQVGRAQVCVPCNRSAKGTTHADTYMQSRSREHSSCACGACIQTYN